MNNMQNQDDDLGKNQDDTVDNSDVKLEIENEFLENPAKNSVDEDSKFESILEGADRETSSSSVDSGGNGEKQGEGMSMKQLDADLPSVDTEVEVEMKIQTDSEKGMQDISDTSADVNSLAAANDKEGAGETEAEADVEAEVETE
jgi:hypothetical protein